MDFAYNASALGAGGVIERGPVTYTIPSLASVALAPTGGEGRSVVTDYVSQELSFSHAETRVFGHRHTDREGAPVFTTSTYVLMKDVNVFGRVRVGEMGSIVTSTRGLDGDDDHEFELRIWFRDVVIDGTRYRTRIDAGLRELRRYDELPKLLTERMAAAAGASRAERFKGTEEQILDLVKERKPVQGSIVAGLEEEDDDRQSAVARRKVLPPVRTVPGLGTVHFGELMLKPGRRRLNLLRIEFGPQVDFAMPNALMMHTEGPGDDFDGGITGGSMTLGSGEGNGIPIGP